MDDDRESMSRLLVAVRIRPISQKELSKDRVSIIAKAIDEKTILVVDPSDDWTDDILRKDRPKEKVYAFDSVFSETASQMDIYHGTVRYLMESVMEGYNATVFAYGATGAGKTFTMLGTESRPGIMALTLADLFNKIQKGGVARPDETCDVSLTYLEIYNENIRDLLSGKPDLLDLRDDGSKGTVVAGITSVTATSAEEVMMFLRRGNRNRSQEPTGANEVSSRSHAVLQVLVTFKRVDARGNHIERHGKLSMIDLAGSERAAETNNRGLRMIEGANINRSLLALGNCINALGETGKRGKYVNYRDSKLTRLLKDSLGGNCKTVMIANISPASTNFDETLNTLKYASRARTIKTRISQQVYNKSEAYTTALNQMRPSGSLQKLSSAATNVTGGFETHGRQSRMKTSHDDARHANDSLPELVAGLESKHKELLSLKNQILEIDEHEAGCILELEDALLELDSIRDKLRELSPKDVEKRELFEQALEKKEIEISEIKDVKKEILGTRTGLVLQEKELEKKIMLDQQQLNLSKDPRAAQSQLKCKINNLEVATLELEAARTLSTALIRQNSTEKEQLYRLIALYEKIVTYQLKERTTPTPSELVSLLTILKDLKEKINIGNLDEGPKIRSREHIQLKYLNERLGDAHSLTIPQDIETTVKKSINLTTGSLKNNGKATELPSRRMEPMIPETSFILPEDTLHTRNAYAHYKLKKDDSMDLSNDSSPNQSPKLGFKKADPSLQKKNFSSSLQNLARQVEDLIRPKTDYVEQFKARNQERVSKLPAATPISMKSDFTNSGTLYEADSKMASGDSLAFHDAKRDLMNRMDTDVSFRRDSVARALKATENKRKAEVDNFKPKDTKKILEMFGSKSARQAIMEQAYGVKVSSSKSKVKSQEAEKTGFFRFKPVVHEGRSRRPTNEVSIDTS